MLCELYWKPAKEMCKTKLIWFDFVCFVLKICCFIHSVGWYYHLSLETQLRRNTMISFLRSERINVDDVSKSSITSMHVIKSIIDIIDTDDLNVRLFYSFLIVRFSFLVIFKSSEKNQIQIQVQKTNWNNNHKTINQSKSNRNKPWCHVSHRNRVLLATLQSNHKPTMQSNVDRTPCVRCRPNPLLGLYHVSFVCFCF